MASLIIEGTVDSDGGSTIFEWEYRIATSEGALASASWLEAPDQTGNEMSLRLDSLAAGSEYFVQTRATNEVGTSTVSDVVAKKTPPPTAPSQGRLEVVPYRDRPLLALQASVETDGGSPVERWEYKSGPGEVSDDEAVAALDWTAIPDSPGTNLFFDLADVLPDNFYWAVVRAVNQVGDGERSAIVSGLVPKVPPYRPVVVLSADTVNPRITINATTAHNGGEPVTSWEYRFQPVIPGGAGIEEATWFPVAGASGLSMTHTITGLREEQEYEIEVRATSSIGRSETSLTSSIFISDLPTTPEIPIFTLAEIDGRRGLRVDAQVGSNGGAEITSWEARWATTEAGVATATWVTIPDAVDDQIINKPIGQGSLRMAGNTLYYVQIRAVNMVGASDPSEILSERTYAGTFAPITPVLTASVAYTATDMDITLSATSAGGADITSWQYRTATTEAGLVLASWVTISGASGASMTTTLADQTRIDRHFQVRAVNASGNSDPSNSVETIGLPAPGKPVLTLSTIDGDTAEMDATLTNNTGQSIGFWEYRIAATAALLTSASWVSIPLSNSEALVDSRIENLIPGSTYHVQVRANNSVAISRGAWVADSRNGRDATADAIIPQQADPDNATDGLFRETSPWQGSSDNSLYFVYYQWTAGNTQHQLRSSFSEQGHRSRVRADDSSDWGSWGSWDNGATRRLEDYNDVTPSAPMLHPIGRRTGPNFPPAGGFPGSICHTFPQGSRLPFNSTGTLRALKRANTNGITPPQCREHTAIPPTRSQ